MAFWTYLSQAYLLCVCVWNSSLTGCPVLCQTALVPMAFHGQDIVRGRPWLLTLGTQAGTRPGLTSAALLDCRCSQHCAGVSRGSTGRCMVVSAPGMLASESHGKINVTPKLAHFHIKVLSAELLIWFLNISEIQFSQYHPLCLGWENIQVTLMKNEGLSNRQQWFISNQLHPFFLLESSALLL